MATSSHGRATGDDAVRVAGEGSRDHAPRDQLPARPASAGLVAADAADDPPQPPSHGVSAHRPSVGVGGPPAPFSIRSERVRGPRPGRAVGGDRGESNDAARGRRRPSPSPREPPRPVTKPSSSRPPPRSTPRPRARSSKACSRGTTRRSTHTSSAWSATRSWRRTCPRTRSCAPTAPMGRSTTPPRHGRGCTRSPTASRSTTSGGAGSSASCPGPASPTGAAASPEKLAMDARLSPELARALARIPERQRSALLLAEVHELTGVELAAALGTSHVAARALLTRARDSLRRMLAEERAAAAEVSSRRREPGAPTAEVGGRRDGRRGTGDRS